MDTTTTALVIVLGILALAFVAFFAKRWNRGTGEIKGPFGTRLKVEGSNESQPTRVRDVEAGQNVRVSETGGRGVDAAKVKAGGDVDISSSSGGGASPPKK